MTDETDEFADLSNGPSASSADAAIADLAAKIAKLPKLDPVPVRLCIFANESVPLTRTDPKTGEVTDALFWRINGDIHVHPERWELFVSMVGAGSVTMLDMLKTAPNTAAGR
jgi:hypothetical protein